MTDEDQPTESVIPGFKPGKYLNNLVMGLMYGFLFFVGIFPVIYGLVRHWRDDTERVMGLTEKVLSVWIIWIGIVMIAAIGLAASGVDLPEPDSPGDSNDNPDTTPTSGPAISSVIEIIDEEVGLDPIGPNDQAPGYFEYEILNTDNEGHSFYVHVAYYDGNGVQVLCQTNYHILSAGDTDTEYSNPAAESFAHAEIVDIVENEEDGRCA